MSRLFTPSDFLRVKCNSFTKSGTKYTWDLEYGSIKPDALVFVSSDTSAIYRCFYKLDGYKSEYSSRFYVYAEIDDITQTSYITSVSSGNKMVYAKYGDFYVRVTGYL